MQRVSQQLIRELERKPGIKVSKAVTNVYGEGFIGLKTFAFLLNELAELPTVIRNKRIDVVLFSSMVTASLAYFIRSRVEVPLVTINHGRDVTLSNPAYQWLLPKIFNSLDGVISVSRATRQECISRGMDPQKGAALSNGFDFKRLNSFPDKNRSRIFLEERFGVPLANHFMLLTVGRKVRRKGHEWFIKEVLPQLKEKEKIVYVTIGDGPEFDRIERAVSDAGGGNQVFLLGRQPDRVLKKAYAAADLFVMPNIPVEGDMEGFGIVLLEANMARTPAVASDLEGIKDVITQGENGFLISPFNAADFAGRINTLLQNDLEQISERARTYVQHKFSWKKVSEQYLGYLEQVIDSYGRIRKTIYK